MWIIEPGLKVGPLRLGIHESKNARLLGTLRGTFRRTPESVDDILAYDEDGVHLVVNGERTVIQILVFQPMKVSLAGVQLLGRDMIVVAEDLGQTEYEFVPVDAGLECETAGIVLVEVDEVVDGVEVSLITTV